MQPCRFLGCKDHNKSSDYHMYIVESGYALWFCPKHWEFICFLFNTLIKDCIRNNIGCERNHKAEVFSDEKALRTVKFDGKYFDVCNFHMDTLIEIID